ncbi:c-type cytochrome [Chromobacterium subtsugae]|uniref:C-type cytochrome n=3 Tax=Chromobacterium subtsugae TaxID=251747 RepID=A0ABS7FA74_9NEIS|nr:MULTISPECIES: c-type cytochrome [Chromobacterium]MBW7567254.1 c-type cytochrome [Chromobacterium subtsugae]MBW8286224.1 c-type cytochrome [Chromobacterium subtsugae]WSE91724.1 c-type cytochrome [Chromobacterium subtsugae]WVH60098.1 c-type cytochrome [Chromobacterium subtsugae]
MKTAGWMVLGWMWAAAALAAPRPAELCGSCHGADGNGASPQFPRLAGQQAVYMEQQLLLFRDGKRDDKAAHRAALAKLDDAGIRSAAAYFAARAPAANAAAGADPKLVAAGAKLFREGNLAVGTPPCFSCHGDRGEGNATAPRLAGQHAAYLQSQLRVFDVSQRPAAAEMQEIVKTMSEDDIKAVLAYLPGM